MLFGTCSAVDQMGKAVTYAHDIGRKKEKNSYYGEHLNIRENLAGAFYDVAIWKISTHCPDEHDLCSQVERKCIARKKKV